MTIHRCVLEDLQATDFSQKVYLIYGPRRVGKTTLIRSYLASSGRDAMLVSGEDADVQHGLSSQSIDRLKHMIGDKRLLVVDEAQCVPNIGLNLKLLVDHVPGLSILATGSSSFELACQVGEPLTGRKITRTLFPLAQMELAQHENPVETRARLESRMIYGGYPEAVLQTSDSDRQAYLRELVHAYLYKDILSFEGIRKSSRIQDLLRLIALRVGGEVAIDSLGQQLGMSKNTVAHYLELLEHAFVLIRIRSLSTNPGSSIRKRSRYYFFDLGVRNAILNQFNPLHLRQDVGQLWENYMVVERLKKQAYHKIHANNYFWRDYNQQEVDWVEEREGQWHGFEFKWQPQRVKRPSAWPSEPAATYQCIHSDNYLSFIT